MKRFPLFVCLFLLLLLIVAGIPTAAASPQINDIRPGSGPYGRQVTVTITGSGFDSTTTVAMAKCGLTDSTGISGVIYGTVTSRSESQLKANFQLSGSTVVPGDYDVRVVTRTIYGNEVVTLEKGFLVYQGNADPDTTTTTKTPKTATTTATPEQSGDNSVFFETSPSGASIFLNGDEIGTSAFTYKTYKDGIFDVLVKKTGYEDYSDRVTIVEGQRVRFYAVLVPLGSSGTTNVTTKASATPGRSATAGKNSTAGKTASPIQKSTLKVPTPWGTDPPVTEESPVNPAFALVAVGIAIGFVLLRRR